MTDEEKRLPDQGESGLTPAAAGERVPSTEFRDTMTGEPEEEVHLSDYLDVVFRRKWLIITCLFLVFISTLVFTLSAEKMYKAEGTIEVKPENPKITKFEDVVAERVKSEQFYQTQVSLLQSKALAKRVVEELDLENHPALTEKEEDKNKGLVTRIKASVTGFVKSLLPEKKENPGPGRRGVPEDILKEKGLLGYIDENMEVSPKQDSMLVDISFVSSHRELAKDAVNAIMDEFISWRMDQKLDASRTARKFLMKQIEQAKINLEKAEEIQNKFAKQAGIVSLDSKLNSVYRQLEELNAELAKAENELIKKETAYQRAREAGPSSLPQVLNSQMLNNLKAEYARVRSEYEDLLVVFREDYPRVKSLKARMESINERIENESQKIFESIKNDYLEAKSRVETLKKRLDRQKELALELNERATQYNIMGREVETNKAIYESLLSRAKEIESMVGVSSSNIQIVDQASLPIFPYKPKVKRNLLLAIVLGLMLGIGCAFMVEYFADTISNPDEISDRFRIPMLGVLPYSKGGSYPVEKTVASDLRAPLSEAVRTTKVSIQLSGSGDSTRSLVVTSTAPEEGKTTVATNLAMAFAAAGEKVILVETDLRKPRFYKVFSLNEGNKSQGLSSLLAGIIDKGFFYKTEVENLHIIPSGPIPPNPVELLASDRFTRLVDYLKSQYDRVILDAPPHQGFADVLVLSRKVGGVILVTEAGETTRNALRHFKRGMQNVNSTILGCIVNKVDLTKRYGYRSYYKYYGAYYYYHGDKKHKRLKSKT